MGVYISLLICTYIYFVVNVCKCEQLIKNQNVCSARSGTSSSRLYEKKNGPRTIIKCMFLKAVVNGDLNVCE